MKPGKSIPLVIESIKLKKMMRLKSIFVKCKIGCNDRMFQSKEIMQIWVELNEVRKYQTGWKQRQLMVLEEKKFLGHKNSHRIQLKKQNNKKIKREREKKHGRKHKNKVRLWLLRRHHHETKVYERKISWGNHSAGERMKIRIELSEWCAQRALYGLIQNYYSIRSLCCAVCGNRQLQSQQQQQKNTLNSLLSCVSVSFDGMVCGMIFQDAVINNNEVICSW